MYVGVLVCMMSMQIFLRQETFVGGEEDGEEKENSLKTNKMEQILEGLTNEDNR